MDGPIPSIGSSARYNALSPNQSRTTRGGNGGFSLFIPICLQLRSVDHRPATQRFAFLPERRALRVCPNIHSSTQSLNRITLCKNSVSANPVYLLVGCKLADSEMNANRESLAHPSTREPLWRSNEIPIGGDQAGSPRNHKCLRRRAWGLPKLLLHVDAGVIITPLEPVDIWPGIHIVKDDGQSTVDCL